MAKKACNRCAAYVPSSPCFPLIGARSGFSRQMQAFAAANFNAKTLAESRSVHHDNKAVGPEPTHDTTLQLEQYFAQVVVFTSEQHPSCRVHEPASCMVCVFYERSLVGRGCRRALSHC